MLKQNLSSINYLCSFVINKSLRVGIKKSASGDSCAKILDWDEGRLRLAT